MIQKIAGLINKDVRNESESKNLMVSLRIVLLLMLAYLLAVGAAAAVYRLFFLTASSLAFFALFSCSLASTYQFRTLAAYYGFSAAAAAWVFFSVFETGWESGTYMFMLLLLVLRFFEAYTRLNSKVVFAAFLLALTLLLYIFSLHITVNADSNGFIAIFHILNMIAVFGGITVVCWFFSSEALRDEKKLVLYNQRLQHDASTDTLTGLSNRRKMMNDLEESIKRVKNQQQEIFSIAIGDIDHFKKVNDTLGHDCGDVVLQELSKMFSQFINAKGKVARWGGEEFLFIFDNLNGDQALIELHRLMDKVRSLEIVYKKESLKVTMTFGLEEYSVHCSLAENIKNADNKLYLGKSSGRNRIIY